MLASRPLRLLAGLGGRGRVFGQLAGEHGVAAIGERGKASASWHRRRREKAAVAGLMEHVADPSRGESSATRDVFGRPAAARLDRGNVVPRELCVERVRMALPPFLLWPLAGESLRPRHPPNGVTVIVGYVLRVCVVTLTHLREDLLSVGEVAADLNATE